MQLELKNQGTIITNRTKKKSCVVLLENSEDETVIWKLTVEFKDSVEVPSDYEDVFGTMKGDTSIMKLKVKSQQERLDL